jgi:hypothetical protein
LAGIECSSSNFDLVVFDVATTDSVAETLDSTTIFRGHSRQEEAAKDKNRRWPKTDNEQVFQRLSIPTIGSQGGVLRRDVGRGDE